MDIQIDFLTIFTIVKLSLINDLSDNEIYKNLICLGGDNLDAINDPHRHIIGETQFDKSNNVQIIKSAKIETIANAYDSLFANLIDIDTKKKIISAIKSLLTIHNEINSDETIGINTFTKQSILESSSFCFPLLLAAFIKYVVVRKNRHRNDFKIYRETVKNFYDTVHTEDLKLIPIEGTPIADRDTSKINKVTFNKLFKQIKSDKLPTEFKNNSDIKIFMLNIRNSKFDLANLHDFIRDNIDHYVMSFLEEKNYYDEGRTKHLIDDAINKFLDNTKDQNILNAYSKLMLYIFMECGLGAPKLFNAIEIPEKNIASDGVYYLKGGTISDKPMLVLGTSNTFPSLETALENSLIQAELIANHQDDLITFITPSFLKLRFDQDNLSFIVDKLIKAEGLLENEASFGIFLSYSLNETNDGSMTQQDFINHIKEKMEQDITNAIPLIYEKIKSHNLQNYSFFVFVLPLTEVNSDVSYVIKKFSRGETNV